MSAKPVISTHGDAPPGKTVIIPKNAKSGSFAEFLQKYQIKKYEKSTDNLANVQVGQVGQAVQVGQVGQSAAPSEKLQPTHTRIGDQTANIYGGSYHIPDAEYETFMRLYFKEIYSKKHAEYLTERQFAEGSIAVDLDFHFALDLPGRVYTQEHLDDLVDGYLAVLKDIYQFDADSRFPIFIFEKPNINRVADKNMTKDGLHIIIGIKMDHSAQCILRERMIPVVSEMFGDFPLINKWTDVFDEGISKGFTNWQLIGSRKPGHEAYELTRVYDITFDPDDGEFINSPGQVADYTNNPENFMKLSVRYTGHPNFFYKSAFIQALQQYGSSGSTDPAGNGLGRRRSSDNLQMLNQGGGDGFDMSDKIREYSRIRNRDELDQHLQQWLDHIQSTNEYHLREAYEYTMVLPEMYYGEGSYSKWIRVGWALKNTSARMLIVWLAFSAKAPAFSFSEMSNLCDQWCKFEIKKDAGISNRSIIYWAMHDNHVGFESVKKNTVGYYLDQTINAISVNTLNSRDQNVKGCGDYDLASVLHQMFKNEYVCTDIKNSIWYRFKNNRWKLIDTGTTLRLAISKELRDLYNNKAIELLNYLNSLDEVEEKDKIALLKTRVDIILYIVKRLGQTNDKKNIMIEAKDLFYDPDFRNRLDSNPYLLCCKNGVIDFKEKCFRKGLPEDYLTKCTDIDYFAISAKKHDGTKEEINTFMSQLFPDPELKQYMWEHLASCLIGVASVNQTFNNYIGIGANGKSVLTDLMSQTLGSYKAAAPISLITQGRVKIGGLSPEIVALQGVRYVVMQEPSKGDVIHEGPMKELVSGVEPITARGLFQDSITFVPQFKLIVCANELMEVKGRDHGTWRRLRIVPFEALFCENPETGDPDRPHQFLMDRHLTDKFSVWRETFLAMLVDVAYKTNGLVKDCPAVLKASNDYRERQDYLAQFIKDKIVRCPNSPTSMVAKGELGGEFKIWYQIMFSTRPPNTRDLFDLMDKLFGPQRAGKWSNLKIKYNDRDNDDFGSETSANTVQTVDDDDIPDDAELVEG